MIPLSAWQSLLFVPAHDEKRLASAIKHEPDAIILDLEDGVGADTKPVARALLAKHIAQVAAAGIGVVVRVNSNDPDLSADIRAADHIDLSAIMIPKCDSLQKLHVAVRHLGHRVVPMIALIESPTALPRLFDIAADPHVAALMFGPEDYAASLGVSPGGEAAAFAVAHVAAAAAGAAKTAWGIPGSLGNFTDLEQFRADLERGAALGMKGAAAIHPAQLPIIRSTFAPSTQAIEKARGIVEAAAESNSAAFKLDGQMIDAAVVAQAQNVLKRAKR